MAAMLSQHFGYLRQRLQALDLWSVLAASNLSFATFAEIHLAADIDDRSLWNHCQRDGWVLFTENRNDDGPDSLHAT
jgi:hypothetical protein